MEKIVGVRLAPTYNYFRIYRGGDICRVHSDRPACEHSMTLTLAYSDGIPWEFQVGRTKVKAPSPITDGFGEEKFAAITMQPGDAVVYRGMDLRHGRVIPNPNTWSAHMFLHWVERAGQFADHSFEGGISTSPVEFDFS